MTDPFSVLGLERRFDLEAGAIRRAHLGAVARLHPDAADGEEEGEGGAVLNQAKQVLMDPERRADALLRLLGGPSKEADKTLPPGYLMEMMETRQEIEAASSEEEKQRWRDWVATRRAEHVARVGTLFANAAGNPVVLKEIRVELNAWRYVERLVEQLDGREGDFGG